MKFIAITDLHLDKSTAGADRFADVMTVLDAAVLKAQQERDAGHEVAFLFLGDLCDPNTVRAHRSVAALIAACAELNESEIDSFAIVGNHDVIEDGSGGHTLRALDASQHALVFDMPRDAYHLGVRIIALPFTASSHNYDPDAFIRSLEPDERPTVVIGHLNLEGITAGSETLDMPRGRDVFWPLDALADCFPDAILLGGHYHQRQLFKGVNIIGSAVRLAFDERNNQCGYAVIEIKA